MDVWIFVDRLGLIGDRSTICKVTRGDWLRMGIGEAVVERGTIKAYASQECYSPPGLSYG